MASTFKHFIFTNLGVGIRDELWLLYRVEIFLNTLVVSMAAQQNKGFEWIIFYDEALPVVFLRRVSEACASSGLCFRLVSVTDYSLIGRAVSSIIETVDEPLITSRIDDDDLLHCQAIDLVQRSAEAVVASGGIALISLQDGMEFLPADGVCRPVSYESIALGLSIVDASSGSRKISVTHFAHHVILDNLKNKHEDVIYAPIKHEEPLYLYTKHTLSDSYYFGARARVLADEKTQPLEDLPCLSKFGLDAERLSYLALLLRQAPLGMPHKYLEKLGAVRNALRGMQEPDSETADILLSRKRKLESKAVRPNPTSGAKRKVRVAILGSCVSRDFFEIQKGALDNFEICFYMARSSVVSYMSLPVTDPSLDVIGDGFEARRSQWDCKKTHWQLLERSRPDIVLVDFIDERIGLIRHQGAIVSASGPNLEAFQKRGSVEILRPWSSEVTALRNWALPMFVDKLVAICPNIFLHRATWAERYIGEDRSLLDFKGGKFETLIELNNSILLPMFSQIDEMAAPIEMIGGIEAGLVAGGDHKWSLCPYHYDAGYYKGLAKQLKARIG